MRRDVFAVTMIVGVACAMAWAEEATKTEQPAIPAIQTTSNAAPTEAAAAPAPSGPAPKISFDQTTYDFGTTSQVDQVAGKFTFKNSGEAVLELKKPTTSCGCTVAKLQPETLKPGETGELSFTLNIGMSKGHIEKHITVPSNDPQTPSVNLTIKADIKPTFEINPQQINLGDLHQGITTNAVVTIKRVDGKKLAISKVEPSNPTLTAKIQPSENPDEQSAQILIEAKADGAPRRFTDSVKIFTEATDKPAFIVTVVGRVIGDIALTPEALFWGISDPSNWPGPSPEVMTTRKVTVASTKNEPLELRNVTSTVKELTLEVETVETGKTYTVLAKLSQPPAESERGTISFETNYASQPKVDLPVIINVLKR